MDAISFLKAQHRDAEALFEALREERARGSGRHRLVQLADFLLRHAAVEEARFYRAVLSAQTETFLRGALEEHLNVRLHLAELLDLQWEDPGFLTALARLEKSVLAHVAEEERVLLPMVERAMGNEELLALGRLLELDFEALVATDRQEPGVLDPLDSLHP